jgi:hypothetical protein
MMRLIRNLTGFVFGLILAGMLFLSSLPLAHSATLPTTWYMLTIVAYQNGAPVAAQAMGFADTLETCQKQAAETVSQLTAKPGVTIASMCTQMPPAPVSPQNQT